MSKSLPKDAVAIKTTIHVRKDGNGFCGSCIEFPGVVVGELTEKECLKQTRDAVREHLEILIAKGMKIPKETIVRCEKRDSSERT